MYPAAKIFPERTSFDHATSFSRPQQESSNKWLSRNMEAIKWLFKTLGVLLHVVALSASGAILDASASLPFFF